ncbi:MAG: DNA-3-methyladenine glycosylase [Acidimicrobiales bacterium]|nr:DNA-3-methyladenine glycosylase [Acidimicrobiales bacterium]
MNRVVESIFRFPPSELRRKRRVGDVLIADGGLRLRLPFVEPLDRDAALGHLEPRLTPGVELVEDAVYRRTLEVCGNPGVIEVDLGGDDPHLELTAHLPTFDSIIDDVARIRTMFGLDDDVHAAEQHLLADPLLAPAVRVQPGLRVIGGWDRFETAVRVIVGQQVSVVGATTITGRIVERHGAQLPGNVLGLDRLFPTADSLVDLAAEGLGMPGSRVATIRALARAVVDGTVDLAAGDHVREQLLGVKGIGPWTADVVAMRATRDPDVIPVGDLGIRHAVGRMLGRDEPPTAAEVEEIAAVWSPHRSLAAQHLWTSLSSQEHWSPHERAPPR